MTHTVFIDGEAGTTGLKILERLKARNDLTVLHIADKHRKDVNARADALNSADISILCLPESASKEAVSLIEGDNVRVIDASIAYRTHPDWVFGFPEYGPGQREKITKAKRVTNPGCYSCGAIAILYPLVKSGLIEKDDPITINAVSGYTGGGNKLIAAFEDKVTPEKGNVTFYHYALSLEHKHTEEIRYHSGLNKRPIFVPSVGRFAQGMIVSVPLQLWALGQNPTHSDLHSVLSDHYNNQSFVIVECIGRNKMIWNELNPEALNNTNLLKLFVFGNEKSNQAVLTAVLDNLGKGASGQAVQCLNLMLGLKEETGL